MNVQEIQPNVQVPENEQDTSFEESVRWYFEEREKKQREKLKKFEEKAARKPDKKKRKNTWKNMWGYRKRKLASYEQEHSSDDECVDYDNLHLSFDPEKSPKFSL